MESKAKMTVVIGDLARLYPSPINIVEVIVRSPRREKTSNQRGYWHVLLDQLGQELGYQRPKMKEIVKQEYYGIDVDVLPNGQRYETVQSSEDEDRAGYGRLIDFTLQFAAEQGYYLQDPRPIQEQR